MPRDFKNGIKTNTIQITGGTPGSGKVLTDDGSGNGTWQAAAGGSGDVVGPASSTDNAIARYNGTTGKIVQNSSATISDTGEINASSLYVSGGATVAGLLSADGGIQTDSIIPPFAGTVTIGGVILNNSGITARVRPRTGTATSSATPTINTDNVDFYSLTAQAVDITSFTTNLSGTPTNGQKLWIAITGTAARTITWGTSFEASTVALPTTTVSTNRLDVGFVWNTATSKWRCVAVA